MKKYVKAMVSTTTANEIKCLLLNYLLLRSAHSKPHGPRLMTIKVYCAGRGRHLWVGLWHLHNTQPHQKQPTSHNLSSSHSSPSQCKEKIFKNEKIYIKAMVSTTANDIKCLLLISYLGLQIPNPMVQDWWLLIKSIVQAEEDTCR